MGVFVTRRRELAITLGGLGTLVLGIGLILGTMAAPPLALGARFERSFPPGPWQLVPILLIGTAAMSVILTIAAVVLRHLLRRRQTSSAWMKSGSIEKVVEELRPRVEACMLRPEPDTKSALDLLLRAGLLMGASDIHFNPLLDALNITYRIDGVLHSAVALPLELSSRFSGRVKVLARLDSFSNAPQDGSLRRRLGDLAVEARVSCLPSNHGERIVLRLVRGNDAIAAVDDLGFDSKTARALKALIQRPQGMFYVSGPVGSGKTTTLYSLLQYLHQSRGETTSIVTLEDPIEVQLPFATQTQINRKIAMSFAETLRSVLRQDPGALMLGEIRDKETAEIATQAALTGHLILSTIHVQSAAGTFARLIEMNIEPFVLASSCSASLAQRLVRELCPHCREPAEPNSETKAHLEERGATLPDSIFYEPVGCVTCEYRGYLGRLPIAELLIVSESIQVAIRRRAGREEIHRLAVAEGMTTLLESGLNLARSGKTSLAEVVRVAD